MISIVSLEEKTTKHSLLPSLSHPSTWGRFYKVVICKPGTKPSWETRLASILIRSSPVVLVVENQPAKAGDIRNNRFDSGWRRSPGGGHSNPLQYSCQENPMDRGPWWATVHAVTMSQKWLSTHTPSRTKLQACLSHLSPPVPQSVKNPPEMQEKIPWRRK